MSLDLEIAQTESILRLLKDGKIVGYERHKPFANIKNSNIIIIHTQHEEDIDSDDWNIFMYPNRIIEYDSFELGIKVGIKWWFVGDEFSIDIILGHSPYENEAIAFSKGIIVFKYNQFLLKLDENHSMPLRSEKDFEGLKYIGTIHDKVSSL